jgi:hypothetical protein
MQITLSTVLRLIAHMGRQEGFAIPPSEDGKFPGKTFREYAEGLLAPRQEGSLTEFGLGDLDPRLVLKEYQHPDISGCTGYKLVLPEGVSGYLGAYAEDEVPAGLEVLDGTDRHGPVRYVDRAPEVALAAGDMPPVGYLVFLIGPSPAGLVNARGETRAVWTWFPGPPKDPEGAVKAHNGGITPASE